jgi:uncharacterized protein (DUF58 family)
MLFDETTLRKISQLTLVAAKARAGVIKGDRRSTKRGESIEFADYRNYVKGDDLRRLDWNVYARLDRPFIKLLEEEEDLAVSILLDISTSMRYGESDQHKITYALRLAGAIGAIALTAGDRLTVVTLQTGAHVRQFGPIRGSQQITRLLTFLEEQLTPEEQQIITTDLNRQIKAFAAGASRPGMAFILSDFFSPTGFSDGLSNLLSQGYEVAVLHILCPEELDPPLAGDLSLVDSETGQTQEVSMDGSLREAYRQRVQSWKAEIRLFCQKRGAKYFPINTSQAWDKVILFDLRKSGIVK